MRYFPDDVNKQITSQDLICDGDWQVMQFTGLTDKNGADIFESDIVTDNIGIGIIEYADKYAGFRVNYVNDRYKWFYDYLDREQATIEIIGNIHQNKDLLK